MRPFLLVLEVQENLPRNINSIIGGPCGSFFPICYSQVVKSQL